MDPCNHYLNEAPGCQFSSPFVFTSSVLLDTPALLPCAPFLRIYPQDVQGPGPCHMEWGKWFLVTLSAAWQNWFAAVVPAESWHHVKAFITGDMLIANLHKNHELAVNVPFVYKESFIFRYFPSLLLPRFLGKDHGALTTAFVLLEILPLCFICLLTYFFPLTIFLNAIWFCFFLLWKGLFYPSSLMQAQLSISPLFASSCCNWWGSFITTPSMCFPPYFLNFLVCLPHIYLLSISW